MSSADVSGSDPELVTRHVGAIEPDPDLAQGALVGRYVIVERIAAGGMGTVYNAYDPRLNRRVALKLLRGRRGELEGTNEQRLIREAQALAQLSSPNVVQVYEVGTAEVAGRGEALFLAMELAEGQTMRDWWQKSAPRWPEVVGVLLAAGRGLADAHAVGLVHRDFKPANVLVSSDGRVRVVDFGLAKIAGEGRHSGADDEPLRRAARESDADLPALTSLSEQLTELGTVVGTPAYMAPEQHRGEAGDERSDQYSFCVTLYEALYGARPFTGSSYGQLLQLKATMAVSAPPVDRRVPAGLRKIVLRGLSPDRSRRWPSVAVLLVALEAFLARRRRFAVGAGVAVATGVAVAVLTMSAQDSCAETTEPMAEVWPEERKDELAAAFAGIGTSAGTPTWGRVATQLDAYASAWTVGRIDACERHRSGAQSDALLDRRMGCLDEALRSMQAITETFADADADVVAHADAAVRELPLIERCENVDAMLADVAPPSDAALAAVVADVRDAVARSRARLDAGKIVEARADAAVAAERAHQSGYVPVQAEALLVLGRAEFMFGDAEASALSLDEAFRLGIASGHDRVALLAATGYMLVVGHKLAQPDLALARRTVVEALVERTVAAPPERARAMESIASALRGARRFDEAYALLHEAVAIRRELAATDPIGLARSLNNFGNVLRDLERYEESVAAFEEAIALYSAAESPDHPNVATSLSNLVKVRQDQGRGAEALGLAERAWGILNTALGSEHAETADALAALGGTRWVHGEREQAIRDLERAIEVLERKRGPEHTATVSALSNYGALLIYAERFEDARDPLERALKVAEADAHGRVGAVAFLLQLLGRLEAGLGNTELAQTHLERAVAYVEEHDGPTSAKLVIPLEAMGQAARARGELAEALALIRRAIDLAETADLSPRTQARLHAMAGELLSEQQKWNEAVANFEVAERHALAGAQSDAEENADLEEVRGMLATARRAASTAGPR